MFTGTHKHTIDDKGRLTVPVAIRRELENGGRIIQGFDHNLMIYTITDYDVISQRILEMSVTDPLVRELRRIYFGNSLEVEFDKAGRVLIPQIQRQLAGLTGDVYIVGAGNYVEIWDSAVYEEKLALQNKDPEINAEKFKTLDLSMR